MLVSPGYATTMMFFGSYTDVVVAGSMNNLIAFAIISSGSNVANVAY